MKFLSRLPFSEIKGRTFLLRTDFNIQPKGKDPIRIKESLASIQFIVKNKGKVILISHRGRPKGMEIRYSLKPLIEILSARLRKKVIFFRNFDFPRLRQAAAGSSPGSVFLLENLRFLAGEEQNSPALAKKLASLGDFYVNDAFAVCHRKNASVAAVTRFIPSFAGFLLEKEILNLDKVFKNPKRPLVIILGGAKISTKIGLIKHFLGKTDRFLLGGGLANTFFAAQGLPVGDSVFEPSLVGFAGEILKKAEIHLPVDLEVKDRKILDVGPETVKGFSKFINSAGTVIWNGPMGFIENKNFRKGSEEIAKVIAGSGSFSIVGGGETAEIISDLGLEEKIGLVSTGGGAMLEYLSGRKLPGIEALK